MGPHDIRTGVPIRLAAAERAANLVDLVHRSVERHPDRLALRWKVRRGTPNAADETKHEAADGAGWVSWTYRELWDRVEAVSIGLARLGMRHGDRVAILSRSRPEWVVADLACLAVGTVTCPIYSGERPDKVAFMVRNVDARFIFAENATLSGRSPE